MKASSSCGEEAGLSSTTKSHLPGEVGVRPRDGQFSASRVPEAQEEPPVHAGSEHIEEIRDQRELAGEGRAIAARRREGCVQEPDESLRHVLRKMKMTASTMEITKLVTAIHGRESPRFVAYGPGDGGSRLG